MSTTPSWFLDPPVSGTAHRVLVEAENDRLVGTRLGAYRVTETIATSGMSTVFRAKRDDGAFEQVVAIKVLPHVIGSARARERFTRERRILARLEHPSISRLLDGGTTGDGRPYIVMEHVHGVPLNEATHVIGIRDRLKLFATLCEAVHYAHRNLVVHRDLKPANILVTPDGAVKLLDFGISRLLGPDQAAATETTTDAASPMTLRYASPEQINGNDVTTATDVYALGVILYEVVTGRPPYDVGSSLASAVRAIGESAPLSASSVVPETHREIDAIIGRAMEKDPALRYESASALAADIARHLDGRTVLAHPRRRSYLLAKAARRHRWPLAIGTGVLGALAIFAVVVSMLALDLARAERQAQRERDEARVINAFLAETLVSADPLTTNPADLSLPTMLEHASTRLAAGDVREPRAASALHQTLGQAYMNLAMTQRAALHYEAAIRLERQAGGDSATLAEALASLADVHLWNFRSADADRCVTEALALRPAALDSCAPDDVRLVVLRARVLREQGRCSEGLEELAALTANLDRAGRMQDEIALEPIDERSLLLLSLDRGDQAIFWAEQSVKLRRKLDGEGSHRVADGLERLAWVVWKGGGPRAALAIYEEVIDLRATLETADHPSTIMSRLHAGVALAELGAADDAEAMLRRAVGLAQTRLPRWHRRQRYALSIYASFLLDQERPDEARPYLRAARDGAVRLWGTEHPVSRTLRARLDGLSGDVPGKSGNSPKHVREEQDWSRMSSSLDQSDR